MARHYSCTLMAVLVLYCAFAPLKKVACIRLQYYTAGRAAGQLYKLAGGHEREEDAGATWKHGIGYQSSGIGTWSWQRSGGHIVSGGGKYNMQLRGAGGSAAGEMAACSPCEEVYVVRDEGETLQTISHKCHAPFILLDNPHVQDTDDISAGSVLLISSTHLPCSHL